MSDLETELRAMLQERAGDITTLPVRLLPTAGEELVNARRHRGYRSRTGWLVAAAVAVVLVVATAVLVSDRHDRSAPPPAQHTTSRPTPPTPESHAPRKAKLAWFGMNALAGFDQHLWSSKPGYRLLALRARADQDMPVGCNGCEVASDYVFVFDRSAFDATKYHVRTWSRAHVGGRTAYVGTMRWYGVKDHTVPTIAWEFRSDEWAIVQGVTPLGGEPGTLKRVAAAVRPTESVPIEVPFTLGFVPSLPVTEVTDDRAEGYAFSIAFGTLYGRRFDITLWPQAPNTVKHTAANRRLIGGLPGYYDRTLAVADVAVPGGVVEFGLAGADEVTTAADRLEMDVVVNHIGWSNGTGGTPWVAAEDAIP